MSAKAIAMRSQPVFEFLALSAKAGMFYDANSAPGANGASFRCRNVALELQQLPFFLLWCPKTTLRSASSANLEREKTARELRIQFLRKNFTLKGRVTAGKFVFVRLRAISQTRKAMVKSR